MSFPRELTLEQQRQLVAEVVQEITTAKEGQLPYSFAIHRGEGHNPHLHLMVSKRVNDGLSRTPGTWCKRANRAEPEKGGAIKVENLERKERLLELHQIWAEMANAALERAGHSVRIDHRSLIDQGIDRSRCAPDGGAGNSDKKRAESPRGGRT